MHKIELLAPAGDKASFIGAINAGANAVYLSGKKFGARSFADNFELQEIFEAIDYAHLRDAKVYVTINTLVYDNEIKPLLEYTDELVKHHVDALIIQDLGLIEILSKRYPDTALHASTQVNTLNVDQAKFLKGIGIKRIILARETSIDTINKIKEFVDIELEVFVHGALCISYSGNCLFSSMIGGRSGNRGECAQSCRLPYELMKDGDIIEDNSYLLSAKDLVTIDRMEELLNSGVTSLKIEGRMRKPEYVIQTVLSYKKAINHIFLGGFLELATEMDKLVLVFNRGQTGGYLFSEIPKNIVNSDKPNHMGVKVGKVLDFNRGKVTVTLTDSLHVGDGIRFIGRSDFGMEVSRIMANGISVSQSFAGETIILDSPEDIEVGSDVHKTLDQELEKSLSHFGNEYMKAIYLDGVVNAIFDQKLSISATDSFGRIWTSVSDFSIPLASKQPVTKDNLREHFSKLGNTPFEWNKLEIQTDELGFVPVKIINELRRSLIEKITESKLSRKDRMINSEICKENIQVTVSDPDIIVSVSTQDQFDAAIESNIKIIYVNEDLQINESNYADRKIYIRKKRIWPNGDSTSSAKIVISEIGHIQTKTKSQEIISDEFLNVTNIHSIHFLHRNGVSRVSLSPETNRSVIQTIVHNYILEYGSAPNLEKVVYGREELMISKYCPIAKTFDTQIGCNLCYSNQYSLKDRKGEIYPLINDGICNIKILHSKPLVLIDYIPLLLQNGINTLRLNFSIEDKHTTLDVIAAYQKAMQNLPYNLSRENVTTGRFNATT